jgi:hypothetical protein
MEVPWLVSFFARFFHLFKKIEEKKKKKNPGFFPLSTKRPQLYMWLEIGSLERDFRQVIMTDFV